MSKPVPLTIGQRMMIVEHAAKERLRGHLIRKYAGFTALAYSEARDTSVNFARFSVNDLHSAAQVHGMKLSHHGAAEVVDFMVEAGMLVAYRRTTETVYCSGPIAKMWCQDLIDGYIRCGTPRADDPTSMESAYARAKEEREARRKQTR